MASECKKSQIWPYRPWKMTFRAIQPNLSFDMWFMSPERSSMPKKKKSYCSVSEIDPSPLNRDGQTGGRTDRTTLGFCILFGTYLYKKQFKLGKPSAKVSILSNIYIYFYIKMTCWLRIEWEHTVISSSIWSNWDIQDSCRKFFKTSQILIYSNLELDDLIFRRTSFPPHNCSAGCDQTYLEDYSIARGFPHLESTVDAAAADCGTVELVDLIVRRTSFLLDIRYRWWHIYCSVVFIGTAWSAGH